MHMYQDFGRPKKFLYRGAFNNYMDKMRGGEGVKKCLVLFEKTFHAGKVIGRAKAGQG